MAAVFFFLLLSFLHLSLSSPSPTKEGFSVELIHREYSPKSPFYNPADTRYDRLRASIHLSAQVRADYYYSFHHQALFSLQADGKGTFQSKVIPNTNSYFMTINVGTPPSKIVALVSTNSDVVWTDRLRALQRLLQTARSSLRPITTSPAMPRPACNMTNTGAARIPSALTTLTSQMDRAP